MASQKEIKALITLAGKVDPSLQNALLKATGQTNRLKETMKKTGSIAGGAAAQGLGLNENRAQPLLRKAVGACDPSYAAADDEDLRFRVLFQRGIVFAGCGQLPV